MVMSGPEADPLAITIPLPTVRELYPECAGRAVARRRATTCAAVIPGFADHMRAATDAAAGAAADVPQKGLNPDTADCPQSAAVKSGLANVVPPLVPNRMLPGVIAVPLGL